MYRTLNIETDAQHPIAIVKLEGYLAQLEVYKLKSLIDRLIGESYRFLICNLKGLTFIDSAGIGVLMHGRSEFSRIGGQAILVRSLSDQVNQSLNSATVYKIIETFDDAEAAAAMLRRKHGLAAPAGTEAAGQASQELAALAELVKKLEEQLRQMEARLAALEGRGTE